jgi:hypothetical protein
MLQVVESRHREMEATLADAKLLAGRSNDNNDYYLQVSNHLICLLFNFIEMYFRMSLTFIIWEQGI